MITTARSAMDNVMRSLTSPVQSLDEELYLNQRQEGTGLISAIDVRLNLFPPRYRDAQFSKYELVGTEEQKSKQVKLIQYLRGMNSVIMYGNNGTGKTLLAYASMRDKIEKGYSPIYITFLDLMTIIKESYGTNGASPIRLIEEYKRCDYLVIDEIDKSYGTTNEFLILNQIVNARYSNRKPMVLISNSGTTDIIEVLGKSTFERIVEDGPAVYMDWPSYRMRLRMR
jgi:DNA replication protein DnaC